MKKALLGLIIGTAVMFTARSAHAFGLGLYGTGHYGTTNWGSESGSVYGGGGGFVLDTCLARNSIFNYRMSLGADYRSEDIDVGLETTRLHLVNYFGFGVVRTKVLRLWLGPQFTVGGEFGDGAWAFMVGTGVALGLNFNIGDTLTISLTGGGRFEGGPTMYTRSGKEETFREFLITRDPTVFSIPNNNEKDIYSGGWGISGHAELAFIFRVGGDKYGR